MEEDAPPSPPRDFAREERALLDDASNALVSRSIGDFARRMNRAQAMFRASEAEASERDGGRGTPRQPDFGPRGRGRGNGGR